MKTCLLIVFGLCPLAFVQAQTRPDLLYKRDRSRQEVFIEEIGEKEIIYRLSGRSLRVPLREVWKVVFANGDTEEFTTPIAESTASPQVPDRIYLHDQSILEGTVVRVDPDRVVFKLLDQPQERSMPVRDVQRIVFSDGREEYVNESPRVKQAPQQEYELSSTLESTSPTAPVRRRAGYFGIGASGAITSFAREQRYLRFPPEPLLNWELGLVGSPLMRRYYELRLEVLYANKGTREKFEDEVTTITSESKLQYFQINLLPFVLKTGGARIGGALGAGGYYAYKLGATSRFAVAGQSLAPDPRTQQRLDLSEPSDYGLCVFSALYVRQRPLLEVRYSRGYGEVLRGLAIYNQGIRAALFLTL